MELSKDEHAIRKVIDEYAEGMRTANVESLKRAFHEQAILCGYLGDDSMAAPIEGLYEWVASNPAPQNYTCSILSVEITNRVATASVREIDMHGDVIDHFHLLKVGDRWSIVSKLWDSEIHI